MIYFKQKDFIKMSILVTQLINTNASNAFKYHDLLSIGQRHSFLFMCISYFEIKF